MPPRQRHDKTARFTTPVEKCGTCSELAARRGKSESAHLLTPPPPFPASSYTSELEVFFF